MATATATATGNGGVRWNIVETHVLEKRKTRDGRKLLNNYELRETLGRGQFGKVKRCERLSPADVAATTDADAPAAAAAADDDDADDGLGPPPPPPQPTFFSGAPAAPETPATVARRQFAIKCFSKKALQRMKEYSAEPRADWRGDGDGDGGAAHMRVVTALDHVRDEIAIMRSLYHRNVVLLFEVIESDSRDELCLVLELLPRGPCMAFEPATKRFASPLTGGALSDAWAKAHRNHHVLVSDTVGTYQFLAPECCAGKPYDPFKVDVWATGMLLYVFLYGALPFHAESTKELFDEITRWDVETHAPPPGAPRALAPECRDLLRRLLARDPRARISVEDALAHEWLADEDSDDEPLSF
ncbi:hypothetical protein PybrP1_003329 [[Pythium] brassicae (nom. inval.)]|nr:hypothetical protein PybrP1_003329 [[Pythium] brassicae (nom. inval.)]